MLSEDWFEVVGADYGIISILPFKIDVLLSSKSIQFGTKMTRMEPNNKIKLREILRPLCLPLGQYLSSGKILKVFIVYDNVDEVGWTF